MESKMKVKVVMLESTPLPNGKQVYQNRYMDKLFIPITGASAKRNYQAGAKPKELYFLSEEKIQVGDVIECEGLIGKVIDILQEESFTYRTNNQNLRFSISGSRKIVATTDTSLNIPLIPQSFVEKYVEKNGDIDEVMLNVSLFETEPKIMVETRKDGTVIVSKVKDTWTREEVIELCRLAWGQGSLTRIGYIESETSPIFNNFIEAVL